MATHSSTLAWKIPWAEEPGRLQSMGSLGVGHDWATSLSLFAFMHWRRKWQPTPVFLPGESQGRGNLVGCRLWGRTRVGHDWSDLAAAAAGKGPLLSYLCFLSSVSYNINLTLDQTHVAFFVVSIEQSPWRSSLRTRTASVWCCCRQHSRMEPQDLLLIPGLWICDA